MVAAAATEAPPDPDRRVEVVTLDKGEISRTFHGTLRGREYIDFQIAAGAGQRLGVTLKRGNAMNYFNIMAPGANEALFIGSTSGRQGRRMLAADGVYTIRLYLMRAAARRNEHSDYDPPRAGRHRHGCSGLAGRLQAQSVVREIAAHGVRFTRGHDLYPRG
jgi:hypothetical protein